MKTSTQNIVSVFFTLNNCDAFSAQKASGLSEK
jgi:hypothetical protein